MENHNIGINSAWYAESFKKVCKENELNNRGAFVRFSRKIHPFRIDEIWINPDTQEKIFIEHYKDEQPRIYLKEQHGNYFKIECKGLFFDKKYDSIQEAIKEAKSLIQGINGAILYVIQNRNKKAKISNVDGYIKMKII